MSSSLGKRKQRDSETIEEKHHGSTLFVSNLPYSATSTDLKTLFSDIGPVRTAFVVLDHDSGTSKGVGYVSFAIREDAQAAFDKVNEGGEGILLDGRRLRVDWAGSKPHKDREAKDAASPLKKEDKPAKVPKVTQPAGPRDPLAIRTIVMAGLPQPIDSKTLWKKVRKYNGAEKVEYPAKINNEEDPSTAHVLFSTPAAAQEAVNKLHAHVFKGSLLSVTLKKRLDGLAKAPKKPAAVSDPSSSKSVEAIAKKVPAPSRASRLIVRNLPWDITEQDLRAVFLPYGPIYSIHIPTSEPEPKDEETGVQAKPRAKGYAFVWMLSKKDAEKALEGANGSKVHAGMADGMVRDKQKKKKLRREEAKIKQKEAERKAKRKVKSEEDEEGDSGEESEQESEQEGDTSERVIAVDWALSKDKWQEVKAKLEEEQAEEADEAERSEGSESEDDSHIGLHEGSDDDDSDSEPPTSVDGDSDEDMSDEESKPGRPQLPATDVGTTLFVRNIPFEATEDELRTVFRAFGPLRYARITMDHELGRSRGTGFVCFWNKEDADKAIEQSEILRQETMGNTTSAPQKKNPFKLPSLLTPDPSASVAQNLVLHGRTMDVIRAVTRDEASKLKEAGERQREKADKRNLYLLREGIILPNSPAAEGLNTGEIERRTQSFNARRALLRSNPSLYVSRTRLSIRQLPLFVTERMLKRLAIHAVRAFEAEVKAGTREPLTADELTDPPVEDGEDAPKPTEAKAKGKGKGKGRSTGVKQAKIVRQMDRVDPVTGKGRSRGYGFLEMDRHADALRVLRWANNNAAVGRLFEAWWREELQDLLKIEKAKAKEGKGKGKDEEARVERIKKELDVEGVKRAKGALIAEFSIENVQVVKRRSAHQAEQKSRPPEERGKKTKANVKREEDADAPRAKKQKVAHPANQPPVKAEKADKPVNKVGSLIGRKRKERKAKRKA